MRRYHIVKNAPNQFKDFTIECSHSAPLSRAYASVIQHREEDDDFSFIQYNGDHYQSYEVVKEMHECVGILLRVANKWKEQRKRKKVSN